MAVGKHHFVCAKDFAFADYRPRTVGLQQAADAFAKNVHRVQSLGLLPIQVIGAAAMAQCYDTEARKNLNIANDDKRYDDTHPDFDPELDSLRQKERVRLSKEHIAKAKVGEARSFNALGEINLGLMLESKASPIESGADALLGGMVIGSWTALETLAGDLWKEALNLHPKKLASLSGKWHAQGRVESNQIEESNEELSDKKVELRDLQMNDYDLSKHMGTVLRRRYKWGVLESIRRAYGEAFSNHFTDIKGAIEHPSIDALSAVRNVLVHKAGIVDTEFQTKHKAWPDFANAEVSKSLRLTGVVVRDLLTASLGNATALLKAVDVWLLNN